MILKSNPLATMFTYTLKGNTLTTDEAAALIEASSATPIKIELSSLLNLRKVDSAKLFKLSVEKKLPELASLAWKISVSDTSKTTAKAPTASTEILTVQKAPGKLLEQLHEVNGLWAVGAAMILNAAGDGSWWTIRQVAYYWANRLDYDLPKNSVLFQGFERTNGRLEPREFRVGVDRRQTFHVSPTYISLRDALKWLTANDLVERTKHVSHGSEDAGNSASIQAMSRVYYAFRLTERGKEMEGMWGDSMDFIRRAFQERLR